MLFLCVFESTVVWPTQPHPHTHTHNTHTTHTHTLSPRYLTCFAPERRKIVCPPSQLSPVHYLTSSSTFYTGICKLCLWQVTFQLESILMARYFLLLCWLILMSITSCARKHWRSTTKYSVKMNTVSIYKIKSSLIPGMFDLYVGCYSHRLEVCAIHKYSLFLCASSLSVCPLWHFFKWPIVAVGPG